MGAGLSTRVARCQPAAHLRGLSPAQFRRGGLAEMVVEALAEHRLEPHRLQLEMTESILAEDAGAVLETVQRMKRLGIGLSIDDFGTGCSGLSYLKRFNADKVRIDKWFVRQLDQDADDRAIVRAIVEMAHSLGMRVVAEGVERHGTLEALAALGSTRRRATASPARPRPQQWADCSRAPRRT